MARALKVFRTSAGFHDAYVAAPSRKAALEAWGANVDLFARGMAEQVDDPALTAEPLKKPGEVVMRSRGGLADQLKALGPAKRPRAKAAAPKPAKPSKPPSRAALDRAEAALEKATAEQADAMKALEAERAAIDNRIEKLAARQEAALRKLEKRKREAETAYRDALADWSS